jgi:MoaA/NifB/PqqE/SkfB family radical SAM enzyme
MPIASTSVRLAQRAGSLALEMVRGVHRPRLLTHIVTFRCNARCQMCDSWKRDGRSDLDASAIEAAYHKLPKLDAVRLTGGEPFVRSDFARIATSAQRILRPLALHITTNGFLTGPILEYCRGRDPAVPLHLLVSLDGCEENHDRIRGHKGAYRNVMATLRAVSAIRETGNIRLSVNQTIVEESGIADIQPLSRLLEGLGVEHQVVLAYEASGTYSEDWNEESSRGQIGSFTPLAKLGPDSEKRLLSAMEGLESGSSPEVRLAKAYYRKGLAERLGKAAATAPPCAALGRHLRLLPDGSVPVCQFNPARVGNLSRQDLAEMSSTPVFREARDWVEKCPGCWAECEVLPSAIYSGDLFRFGLGLPPRRKVPARQSASQPASSSTPPTGVTAPSPRIPERAKA